MIQSAIFSLCGRYRYQLARSWDATLPFLLFIMLNPSTADATLDDRTIRRCMGFARDNGFGGIRVINLFAFRATSPVDMFAATDPVGPENDRYIQQALREAPQSKTVVCAWGSNARNHPRVSAVLELIVKTGYVPHVLKLNEGDVPAHPLYLSGSLRPKPWFPKSLSQLPPISGLHLRFADCSLQVDEVTQPLGQHPQG